MKMEPAIMVMKATSATGEGEGKANENKFCCLCRLLLLIHCVSNIVQLHTVNQLSSVGVSFCFGLTQSKVQ